MGSRVGTFDNTSIPTTASDGYSDLSATRLETHSLSDVTPPTLHEHSNFPNTATAAKSKKRARVTLACEDCRVRKTRCDGDRPVCGACVTRHGSLANCLYQIQASEPTFSREHVDRLEKKVRDLQSQLSTSSVQSQRKDESPEMSTSPVLLVSISRDTDATFKDHDISQVGERQTDAMGNLASSNETTNLNTYITSSSTASFMRQLRNAVDEKVRTPADAEDTRIPSRVSLQESKPKYCSDAVAHNCILPPRHLADSMSAYFWLQGHALYPFLSKTQFLESYKSLCTTTRVLSEQTMTYCILNVIFAIISQFSNDDAPELRESMSDMYFTRALQLLQIEILGSGSLQLIQALLIMGMYLQSTDTPHRCWVMIGIAIRVAQGLGLHLKETSERMQSQVDRELIRRIWHGCILMDRMLSMTLGQPLMIGRNISDSVPLPASIDETYLSSEPGKEGIQPRGVPSTLAFFPATLELYDIMEVILSNFYPSGDIHKVGPSAALDLNSILQIDKSMSDWFTSLPTHLVERTPTDAPIDLDDVSHGLLRQANVLKLRYLHIQILLFRPVLSRILSTSRKQEKQVDFQAEISLQDSLALPVANKCVIAAQQLIQITRNHQRPLGRFFEPLPAWWYKVFYVYSAATVLVAARLCPALRGTITEESIISSWHHCLEILQRHVPISKSARRCIAALEILDQNIITSQEPITQTPKRNVNFAEQHQLPVNSNVYGPPEDTAGTYEGTIPPYFGDNFYNSNLIESNDIGWLHSVPMDLFQYNDSNMFRPEPGPFYNFTR